MDISGLDPGTYTYSIVVSDGLGGTQTDEVQVTVSEVGGVFSSLIEIKR